MERNPRPCKFFNTPQGCRKGNQCTFSHALQGNNSEQQPQFMPQQQRGFQNQGQKKVCPYFGGQKGCFKGDNCPNLHIDKMSPEFQNQGFPQQQPGRQQYRPPRQQQQQGGYPGSKLCSFFLNGNCKRENCKNLHEFTEKSDLDLKYTNDFSNGEQQNFICGIKQAQGQFFICQKTSFFAFNISTNQPSLIKSAPLGCIFTSLDLLNNTPLTFGIAMYSQAKDNLSSIIILSEAQEFLIEKAHINMISGLTQIEGRIISAGFDGNLKMWTFDSVSSSFKYEGKFDCKEKIALLKVDIVNSNKMIFVGTFDGVLWTFGISIGNNGVAILQNYGQQKMHDDAITSLVVCQNIILTSAMDCTIAKFENNAVEKIQFERPIYSFIITQNSNKDNVLIIGLENGEIILKDNFNNNQMYPPYGQIKIHKTRITNIQPYLSEINGIIESLFIAGDGNGYISVWRFKL